MTPALEAVGNITITDEDLTKLIRGIAGNVVNGTKMGRFMLSREAVAELASPLRLFAEPNAHASTRVRDMTLRQRLEFCAGVLLSIVENDQGEWLNWWVGLADAITPEIR